MSDSNKGPRSSAAPGVRMEEVSADDAGQRLDNFLLRRLKGVPRTRIYRIVRKGEVRVNRSRARPATRLVEGDVVRIPPVRVGEARVRVAPRPELEERILHEDKQLIVIDKPAGMAVHGGSGVSAGVIEMLRASRPGLTLELVHRLDRETSGCLMVAKQRSFLRRVHALLRTRHGMRKCYLAVLDGIWSGKREVDAPLATYMRGGGERRSRIDHHNGKPSLTRFTLVRQGDALALVRAEPVTGRTHQIRVHAAGEGCPVVGDPKYGVAATGQDAKARGRRSQRMLLHAESIVLHEPETGYSLEVSAPADRAMAEAIESIDGL